VIRPRDESGPNAGAPAADGGGPGTGSDPLAGAREWPGLAAFLSASRSLLSAVRWWLVLAGLLAAYAAGLAVGLAVRAAGWWTTGAPWERALLVAAHATVSPALDAVMLTVPWLGTNYTLFPVVVVACVILWRHGLRYDALHLLVVQLGSTVLNPALKFSLVRERPHLFELRGQFALPSFPSGHAIAMTSVVLTAAWLIHRRTGATWPWWAAAVFWVLVIYSRVYLSVHWPTDLIAGILVGAVWLWATMAAFRAGG
jgi:undecaprenyl-diphosphatase